MMGFRSLTRICFYLLTSISFATWILSMLLTHSHYVTMLKATLRPKIVLQKEKNKPLSRTGMFKQYLHNEYNITMDTFERWTNTSNLAARMTDRSNVWQLAGKPDQIFVYSAYYQETYLSKKSILIIGLMRKDMNRMVKMSSCIYWYDDSSFSYRKVPVESVNVLGQHHFTKYRPIIVSCPIADTKKPLYVSIDCKQSSWLSTFNLVKVFYADTLKIPTHNFTMCLSPVFGAPVSPENFVQYFEFNRLLGAELFIVYNTSMTSREMNAIARLYEGKGLAKLVQWTLPHGVEGNSTVWYYAQVAMLNDCYLRNKHSSRYIVTTDLDEFIVPLNHSSWNEFLKHEETACEYNIRSVVLKGIACQPGNDGENVCISTRERRIQSYKIYNHKLRSKYILNTNCTFVSVNIHFNFFPKTQEQPKAINYVSATKALVLHYGNVKLFGENNGSTVTTIDRYMSTLETNVVKIMKKVNSL